jgi:TATA-box binding protein (TBP) (component of TFIID and TFIIIB)
VNATFKIVNVVATAALDRYIDLESLHKRFPREVIHDREIYGGRVAYFKSRKMEGKVSIFPSGKMISVGTKSTDKAKRELRLIAKALKACLKTNPKIRSIVATADLKTSIDLEAFLSQIQKEKQFYAMYEPEQFPGVIVKFPVTEGVKATALLFANGKLVLLGLTSNNNIQEAVALLASRLMNKPTKF